MTTRRTLLRALLASIALAPVAQTTQAQTRPRRVGFLWERGQSDYVRRLEAFKAGMRELGYTEGRNYLIEQRSAQNDLARLPELAAELVALKADVIIPSGNPSAQAARQVTREIPILIVTVRDPISIGLAASLRRPGGNVTGLTIDVASDTVTKRLDLLRQIVPGMRRVGVLYNPDITGGVLSLREFESDCTKLGFESIRAPMRTAQDVEPVFEALKRHKAQGLVVTGSSTINA
jgi:putative ABC transport system substrate-binding protein